MRKYLVPCCMNDSVADTKTVDDDLKPRQEVPTCRKIKIVHSSPSKPCIFEKKQEDTDTCCSGISLPQALCDILSDGIVRPM